MNAPVQTDILERLAAPTAPPPGSGLAAALCAISAKVEAIPKPGFNDFHKYTYGKMPDLLRVLGPLMALHGITVLQSEVGHELIADGVLRVELDFDIVHAASGEVRTVRSSGMAKVSGDRGGFNDRAIQAIGTTVRKYVLIALFNIVVDDLPDNDQASEPDTRRNKPVRAAPKTVVPAPRHSLRAGGLAERAASNVMPLPKKNCRDIYERMQSEIDGCSAPDELLAWGSDVADRMRVLPQDWVEILRSRFAEKLATLRQHAATQEVVWDDAPTDGDAFDIPPMLDRRRQASEPTFVDLMGR